VVAPKTMLDKHWWFPDLNEQVLCIMDEHDEDGPLNEIPCDNASLGGACHVVLGQAVPVLAARRATTIRI
jgi:hypothetical protein